MLSAGTNGRCVFPGGRVIEYWDGGDPQGQVVILHPGTPEPRELGRWGHQPALAHSVRLVSLNRPGYGGSTSMVGTRASLLTTGRDTAAVAAELGVTEYAVLGISGGGPFACATAIADPDRVSAVALVAPVGPWREIDESFGSAEVIRQLEAYDTGGVDDTWQDFLLASERNWEGLADLDDDGRVDLILDFVKGDAILSDPEYRRVWAAAAAVLAEQGLAGYVFDRLAWGGRWDIDPAEVTAPARIWDAEGDGALHGRWFASQISGSHFASFPAGGHLDACDGHWPEVLADVLRSWA